MGRPSKGARKALTVRVPLDLHAALIESGGTSNDHVTAVLRRGLVLGLSDDDVHDLQSLAADVGFAHINEMIRVIVIRERHRLDQLREEERRREIEVEPPDTPLAVEELHLPPRLDNGTRPKAWVPPRRPLPPRRR